MTKCLMMKQWKNTQIQQDEATDTKEFVFKASMLHTSPSQMSLYMLFFPLCES